MIFQIRGRPAFDFAAFSKMLQTHLGHAANAFGSCGKRIWVMLQTHLGHVANAFGVQEAAKTSNKRRFPMNASLEKLEN